MRFVEGCEDDIKLFFCGKKAKKLKISEFMLKGRTSSQDISISKIIFKSSGFDDFVNTIKDKLCEDTNTDYLHFSLIMGLYFGYFNLYNYLYIKPNVRKKIIDSNPNRHDTMNFIIKHYSYFLDYFYKKYGISDDVLKGIISRMFFCVDNENDYELLYNNYVTRDVGLILMGNSLSNEFTSCCDAINRFYEENDNCKLKIN